MIICASVGAWLDLFSPEIYLADMAELRLDLLQAYPSIIPEKPLIVTFREGLSPTEFEEKGLNAENTQRWALTHGARYIDLEGDAPLLLETNELQIIRSHHDWESTPDVDTILGILQGLSANVSKAAFTVKSLADLKSIKKACDRYERPHVVLGMGDLGRITRLRSKLLKNEFTFASLSKDTAPGQLSVKKMRQLGDDCIITGLIGHPISHSRSPVLHEKAFQSTGINGTYLSFDVPGSDDLLHLPEVMNAYDIRGLNVTIPYKVSVMEILDRCDNQAESIGAVNTILNRDGKLIGYNTDIDGLIGAFKHAVINISSSKALIVGAGGAARAAAVFLKQQNCEVDVTCRDNEKGQQFAHAFNSSFMANSNLDKQSYDVIINCTPLGMQGFPSELPVPEELITSEQVVMDMVYEPMRTPLLQTADRKGAVSISGRDMLVFQARESFRIWTGEEPDVEMLKGTFG